MPADVVSGADALSMLDLDAFAFAGAPPQPSPPPQKRPAPKRAAAKATGGGTKSRPVVAEKVDAEAELLTPAKKRHRQAAERDAGDGRVQVEVLCSQCRKSQSTVRQSSLAGFFGKPASHKGSTLADVASAKASAEEGAAEGQPPDKAKEDEASQIACNLEPSVFSHGASKAGEGSEDLLFCSRCFMPMQDARWKSINTDVQRGGTTGCPLAAALKRYKREAAVSCVNWELTDSQALAMMREECVLCGLKPDLMKGIPNGITRLRKNDGERSMGPFTSENTATACALCNMLKHTHTLEEVRELCRHIATHRGLGEFGRFPTIFVDNTSKRSRASYIADHKTHALTNEQFNKIVEQPCHYCGKQLEPGKHYNGLDRLDNHVRVYTESTCVSCCGTCNMAKGRHSEAQFLQKCKEIAAKVLGDQS